MRKTLVLAALTAVAALAGSVPAGAQFPGAFDRDRDRDRLERPDDRFDDRQDPRFYAPDGRMVLFDRPGFNGAAYALNNDTSNLGNSGFNDRANSVTVRRGERWQLCEHANFRGRCVTVDRDVPDLRVLGLENAVSSARRVGGGGGAGPGLAFKPPSVGDSAVFYPTPRNRRGDWVDACRFGREDRRCAQDETDRFCREMGHREGAFFQTRNGYLIDVLCVR